jgi:hypothetical protein
MSPRLALEPEYGSRQALWGAPVLRGGVPGDESPYQAAPIAYLRATIEELETQLEKATSDLLLELRARRVVAAQEAGALLPATPEPRRRDLMPM